MLSDICIVEAPTLHQANGTHEGRANHGGLLRADCSNTAMHKLISDMHTVLLDINISPAVASNGERICSKDAALPRWASFGHERNIIVFIAGLGNSDI